MSPAQDSESPHTQPALTDLAPLPRTSRSRPPRYPRFALRHLRAHRPSTVWPCAQDDLHEGVSSIAAWLLTAIVKIVTTYTQPGQRVLLLAPAPPTADPSTAPQTRTAPARYAGLLTAGWTVVRLGRGVQTLTAKPSLDTIDHDAPVHGADPVRESESGSRPQLISPDRAAQHRPSPGSRPHPDRAPTVSDPDRFDLVITAAEPRVLDSLKPTDWAPLLTSTGALAIITHSEHKRGQLHDPARPLVIAAHDAGLRYQDRIALLRIPVRDGALIGGPTGSPGGFKPPRHPVPIAVRHTQAHADLLIFTHQPATTAAAGSEESSDV